MTAFQDNIRLSLDIFSFLRNNPSGEVILTTSKGIYLQFSSRILLITDKQYGITPIGIGLSHFVDFATVANPQKGQPVSVSDGCFCFPNGMLIANWDVVQSQSHFDHVLPDRITQCATLLLSQCSDRSLAALAAPLLLGQELSSVAQRNPYCTRALPILEQLIAGLNDLNDVRTNDSVSQLLGLGIGLTPSMDDVLLGLLYGLLWLDSHRAAAAILSGAITTHAPTHTNAISAAYLDAVAHGGRFERLDNIIDCLCSNTPLNIAPMLEIGSSSGSEMLLGLLLATKITTKG